MTLRVQAIYPHITGKTLLREFDNYIDVFDIEVEEGVQQLCLGMKKIRERLRGKIIKIRIDATCKLS